VHYIWLIILISNIMSPLIKGDKNLIIDHKYTLTVLFCHIFSLYFIHLQNYNLINILIYLIFLTTFQTKQPKFLCNPICSGRLQLIELQTE